MLWKLLSTAAKQQRLAAAWRRELQLAPPTLVPPRCAPLPAEGQLEVLTAVGVVYPAALRRLAGPPGHIVELRGLSAPLRVF